MTAVFSQLETSYHDTLHYIPSPPNTATSTLTLGFLCVGKGYTQAVDDLLDQTVDGLTVLQVTNDWASAAKVYTKQANGTWKSIKDYNLSKWFDATPERFHDLDGLADLINRLRVLGRSIIIRGDLNAAYYQAKAADPTYRIRRLKNPKDGDAAHIIEVERRWIMIDIDKYPLKPGADLATDAAAIIQECVENILPEGFHNARYFWQLSSSAGLKPGVLKVHLFFWLAMPSSNADLRAWVQYYAPHVDLRPFIGNQPHFICDPGLNGAADPLQCRTGWHEGLPEVVLQELPKRDPRAPRTARTATGKAATSGLYAETISAALNLLGDGDGLNGFHAPLLAAAMQYRIRCRRGGLRDDAVFWQQLTAAIEAAPKGTGRDVAEYLDLSYLQRITEGGFDLIENTVRNERLGDDDESGERPDEPEKADERLPMGFGWDAARLWYCEPGNADAKPSWVAHQFYIVGRCENGKGDQWGKVLRWHDEAGHPHDWIVPDAMLHGEPKLIAQELAAKGLTCNYATHQHLRRFLAGLKPTRRLQAVSRAGWHGTSYVLADGTVYGSREIMMRPEVAVKDMTCAVAGTLAEWQDEVARYAVGNYRLAFMIAAALAGALLEPNFELSGGFHIVGPSRIGKTTVVVMGASTIGKGGRGGAKRQWRSTATGLEIVSAACCDGPLVLDEITQVDSKEAGDCVYMIANEGGKIRGNPNITARPTASWGLMLLSTGEQTLAQKMIEAGKRPMAGMSVRLIDIPADAGKGMGVFENLHGFAEPALLADHLAKMSATVYGTAFRAFVERLVEARQADEDGLVALIRAMRQQFLDEHLPPGSNPQVRSIAARFALVRAAGELAAEWNIVPWEVGEATDAAKACFDAWLNARGNVDSGETNTAMAQITKFFEQHGMSRFSEINTVSIRDGELRPHDHTINRCGWRKSLPERGWVDHVLPESWKDEVCKGIDGDRAAEMLAERGLLERDGRRYKKRMIVPEHGRPWVYVIKGAIFGDGDDDGEG